ncbi:hypothetical protein [Oscillibacter sp.]|uniref:hypothetical protein n=1 Tax=Oscillibacter sp. TaxID=1945593 RepID=UPI0028B21DE8|nr:hypothetical protein [Oscillibacter sp.]
MELMIYLIIEVVSALLFPGFLISALKPSSKSPEAYMLLACLCSGVCAFCLSVLIAV